MASLLESIDFSLQAPTGQLILFALLFVSGTYMLIHAELGVLLAWGVIGAFIAIRCFRWNPRPE